MPPAIELRRSLHAGSAALLLLAVFSHDGSAQERQGQINGTVAAAENGAPVPLALVRLLLEQPGAARTPAAASQPVQQVVTTAGGRFRFVNVPAGDYRLQLARIGFRPVLSAVLQVRDGAVVEHEFRAATEPLQLAAVIVRANPTCLSASQLAHDDHLSTLWNEARKGVELRRAVEQQYRFTRIMQQDVVLHWRIRRPGRQRRVDTLVSEPDSVLVRDQRRQARNQASGYAERNLVTVPDEKELLDEAFLRTHCLETSVAEDDGALGVRFRPVGRRKSGIDIRGVIWVDAISFQLRRIEFEYLDGDDAYSRLQVEYADVAFGESVLRLPHSGSGVLRVRGPNRVVLSRATATIAITYREVMLTRKL